MEAAAHARSIDATSKAWAGKMRFIWEIRIFIRGRKTRRLLPLMATAAPFCGLRLFGQSAVLVPFIPAVF